MTTRDNYGIVNYAIAKVRYVELRCSELFAVFLKWRIFCLMYVLLFVFCKFKDWPYSRWTNQTRFGCTRNDGTIFFTQITCLCFSRSYLSKLMAPMAPISLAVIQTPTSYRCVLLCSAQSHKSNTMASPDARNIYGHTCCCSSRSACAPIFYGWCLLTIKFLLAIRLISS